MNVLDPDRTPADGRAAPDQPLVTVEGLELRLRRPGGDVTLVEGLDLHIGTGEALGLVGESGCGKSVTALAIMGLLPRGKIWVSAGRMAYRGADLLKLSRSDQRRLRGNEIAMIFQEPMTSLHPLFSVGRQIGEALWLHRRLGGEAAEREAARLLDMVGIGGGRARLSDLPDDLSGGQRQRVMIAMALACQPRLLIADEPTTALDVTIQAQIMTLIDGLRRELGMALLLISHDLAVVTAHCETVVVMYAGRIVERAPSAALITRPRHPYTAGLMRCVPEMGQRVERLATISGTVPPLDRRGRGCRFADRCGRRLDRCVHDDPIEQKAGRGRSVACWNPEGTD